MFIYSIFRSQAGFVLIALIALITLGGCVSLPPDVKPVTRFELHRYLGKWYEIARLDHSFERGLDHVTAEYSLRDDGGIRVLNAGYSNELQSWKKAEGKAYFARQHDEGYFKVSFFGPFYGAYAVFALDEDYQHAFVTSYNKSYLWLLSRTPVVDDHVIQSFVQKAKGLGFETDRLIFVNQQ